MKNLNRIVFFLLVIAGINWGTWGVFEFNFIYYIFGKEWIDRVIYFIFGLAAIYYAFAWKLWIDTKETARAVRPARSRKAKGVKKATVRRKRRRVARRR